MKQPWMKAPWACLLLLLPGGAVVAQGMEAFPAKPVTVIIAAAPGGPIDNETRVHAKKLGEQFGQSAIMDYKPGARGSVYIQHASAPAAICRHG